MRKRRMAKTPQTGIIKRCVLKRLEQLAQRNTGRREERRPGRRIRCGGRCQALFGRVSNRGALWRFDENPEATMGV